MGIVRQGNCGRKLFASIRSVRRSFTFEVILWALFLVPFFYSNWDLFVFYVFESRDIQRARDILAGHVVLYGPELSGGGNLPGPAYYFLKAAVLWFFDTWEALGHFLFISSAISLGIFAAWFRKLLGFVPALIFLCTLLGPGYYLGTLRFFNNPSFLTPLIIALLFLLWKQPKMAGYAKAYLHWLYFFITTISIQFHMQMAVFFLFPFVVETQFKPGARLRSYSSLFLLCIFGAAPALAPFLWGLLRGPVGQEVASAGSIANAPVFLLESFYFKMQYLLGQALVLPVSDLFDWRSMRRVLQYILAIVPFLYWYVYLRRKYRTADMGDLDRWINVAFWGWIVLLPFGSYYLFTSLAQRYGLVFSVINSLALALVFSRLDSLDRK